MGRFRAITELVDLEALIGRLATIDFSQTSEQATREMAVNPVIGALGWDTFSPGEVAREHPVRGGKVDYCLRGPRGPLVLIEVKRTGTELSEHQEQLLGYAIREGVPLAALTDGLIWWLYLPTAEGSWEQRRFYRIDCREQDTAQAASALHRFLSRDGLVGGTALDEARREFESQERDRRVRATLQDAWRQVLCDPESLLPELLIGEQSTFLKLSVSYMQKMSFRKADWPVLCLFPCPQDSRFFDYRIILLAFLPISLNTSLIRTNIEVITRCLYDFRH